MAFTVAQLKQDIETILSDAEYLGEYTWSDGFKQNAIAVLPDNTYGNNYPPQEVVADRIEAVIIKPEYKNKQLISSDILRKQNHRIFLKQWEVKDVSGLLVYPPRLREATQKLYEELNNLGYDLTSPVYMPYDEKLGIIETSTFDVYCLDVCIS